MIKIFGTFILATFIFLQNVCLAGLADHPTLAVLPYANKAAVSEQLSMSDASIVSEFVVEKLIDSGYFNVVTRNRLLEVTQEQGLQASSLVNPMTSMQMGFLSGAQYLVAGSVSGLSSDKGEFGYSHSEMGSVNTNKLAVVANLTLQIIDIKTGSIVMVASGTGKSASTNAEFVLNQLRTETIEGTGYDAANDEEYIMEDEATSQITHKIRIGKFEFSQVQVRNALYKAADNLVFDKNYGVLAKLGVKDPQKIKRRRV